MKVLVNGCSFSRGSGSWPYKLQQLLSCDLVNLAQAGAGNTYIHETTLKELLRRKYDLVVIMWTGIERVDMAIEDVSMFTTPYTSMHQSAKNDWPEKIVSPINDQDYVEKNWVFGCGHINGDKELIKTKLFESVYRYQSRQQLMQSFILKLISLQSFLKCSNIPYVYSFYEDYENEIKADPLSSGIDWNLVCNNNNINKIMHTNNWFDADGSHPSVLAHNEWAKHIKDFLNVSTQ